MQLARDVLDKEILDRNGLKAGKVDDLVLELREGGPPVVRAIATQHGAAARLLGARMERLAGWLRRAMLGMGPERGPVVIPWEAVSRIDVTVHVDLDRHAHGLLLAERAVW